MGALGQDIGALLLFCWGVAGSAAGAGSSSCRAANLAGAGMGLVSGECAATTAAVSLEGMAAHSSLMARTAELSVVGAAACMGGVRAKEDMATGKEAPWTGLKVSCKQMEMLLW